MKNDNLKIWYAHQLNLAALVPLYKGVFEGQSQFTSRVGWVTHMVKSSVNAGYWFTVNDLQVLLYMFEQTSRKERLSVIEAFRILQQKKCPMLLPENMFVRLYWHSAKHHVYKRFITQWN